MLQAFWLRGSMRSKLRYTPISRKPKKMIDDRVLIDSTVPIMVNSGFLTIEQRNELKSIARKPSEMNGVGRRALAMLWLDDGWSYERIAAALFINEGTVRNWRNHYFEGGQDKLSIFDWQGAQSRLTQAQEAELTEHLDQKLHHDCKEIGAHIGEKYDVHYSHSGCIKLMDRLGFDYKQQFQLYPCNSLLVIHNVIWH